MSQLTAEELTALKSKAKDVRIDILKMITKANSGHTGGSLSAADILTLLFFHEMKVDPKDPKKADRDRLVLSKGHAAPALYAVLAEKGYFPKEELDTLRQAGHMLQGHPDMKHTPGVDMTTGSLGQGFAVSVGMAMAAKMDGSKSRTYVLLGDGELQEGLIWEAAMAAGHYKLDNLCAIVDWNGLQIDGKNDDVMTVKPIDEKFRAFGFNVLVIDGHNFEEIFAAFDAARECKGKPTVIVAKTNKGRGVSFMEDNPGWHGKAPSEDEAKQAVAELGGEW